MKSRCCTFYKNTSESTSLCKLDTDSSPSPPVPCRSCLPRQPSNPEHKWLSAQVGVSRPERGRRVESTFPLDSATFFHFPSWRSAPAQLLILFLSSSLAVNAFFFLLLLPLSWESMDSGLSPKAEVYVHLSLPHPFPFRCTSAVPVLLPARTQCLRWKRKS